MAKIALIRNEHPVEAVAFVLAPRIADELRRRGHAVRIKTVPFRRSVWNTLIRKKRRISREAFEEATSMFLNRSMPRIRAKNEPERSVYTLHNSMAPMLQRPFILYENVVEIPAAYKPTKNRALNQAAQRLYSHIPPQWADGIVRRFYNIDRARKYLRYLTHVAHIPSSEKEGMMDEQAVRSIADVIEDDLRRKGRL